MIGTSGFWLGLSVIPAIGVALGALAGLLYGSAWLWGRFAPPHWWIGGPWRHARPASEVLRFTDVAGGHAKSFRRIVRLGPIGLYVIRYAPGRVEVFDAQAAAVTVGGATAPGS